MALSIITGIVNGIKNTFGGNTQQQTNNQAAAATIQSPPQSQSNTNSSPSQSTRPTPGKGNYGSNKNDDDREKSAGAQALTQEIKKSASSPGSNSNWRNSAAGVDISLGKATTDQKLEAIEQGATPENVGLTIQKNKIPGGSTTRTDPVTDYIDVTTGKVKQPIISEAVGRAISGTADYIRETGEDVKLTGKIVFTDPVTGKISNKPLIENVQDWNDAGTSYEEQAKAALSTVGVITAPFAVGAGAKVASTVAPKIITKLPDIGKEIGKTAAGFTVGGGLAGAGGETEFSKETSKISAELKETASDYIAKADSAPAKIGANIGALALGAAGAAVDTIGALSSARAGAMKIADLIGQGKIIDAGLTFGEGIYNAGKGMADWAENALDTPAFSLGEALGFGGVFKGTKAAVNLPGTAKNALIKEAQADITGSFADLAGLDRTAAENAFKAASNTVGLAQKVNVPLVSKTNVPLQDLTMFEDIDAKTLGKIETSLANSEVVSYGTTANALFGLDFRKTSDFDASVPDKNAVNLVNQILEDTKAYGTRPSKPITAEASSYQIERPSPQTGKYAHMFDLKKLEEDIDFEQEDYTTSVFARTPTRDSQYLKIQPEGAKGSIKVEPLEFALSRKYAAVYFPRTDKLADNSFNFVAPKTISYKTKIDLDSYKTGLVTDGRQTMRNVPITGAGFKVARVAGVPGSVAAKLKTRNPEALGTINTKINYPIELGDTHRMKDALDLVGMTWEYQNKLAKRGTINPVKGVLISRKFSRNLETMLKDDYLRAQVRTGAKDKLSDLSPEFATFLQSKGILTDKQLNRVVSGAQNKAVETAFLSGSPNFKQLKLQFSPITPGAKAKASPITPMTTPVKITQVTAVPSPNTPQQIPKPPKDEIKLITKPPAGFTDKSLRRYPFDTKPPAGFTDKSLGWYPFDTTPKPERKPTITGIKQPGRTAQKNIASLYYPGDDFLKFGSDRPNKKRGDEDKDRRDDRAFFRTIKTQRIDHLGIYDPLEFLGTGSMTKRSRPELTNYKRTFYEVDGGFQTRKPKGRTRR